MYTDRIGITDAAGRLAAALVDRLSGDREMARELARTFLAEIPRQFTELADAVRRVECRSAAGAAHTLKGSVGIFGESDALTAAGALEHAARSGDSAGIGTLAARLRLGIGELSEAATVLLRGPDESPESGEVAGS